MIAVAEKWKKMIILSLFFRSLVVKLNGLRELTLRVSEMPANQECQPDIRMRTIALTILIS